jgi:hypothetical protein
MACAFLSAQLADLSYRKTRWLPYDVLAGVPGCKQAWLLVLLLLTWPAA